jgi:hypothetical protein
MDPSTRRVEIRGVATSANELWMLQIVRNLTDATDGFFRSKRYLIHDRDPFYTRQFLSIIAASGIEAVKLPPRSPNMSKDLGTVDGLIVRRSNQFANLRTHWG